MSGAPSAGEIGSEPQAAGWRRRWADPRLRTAVAIALLLAALLIPLRALVRYSGAGMEEGFMLVFPEQVLAGKVAHRDFLHLYGPGSLWVLAGAFRLFGTNVLVERMVGLAQILGMSLGVYGLARWWGRRVAVIGGAMAGIFTMTTLALTAIPWVGGVALTLGAVVAAVEARRRRTHAVVAGRFALVAGLAGGLALLYRPDLVLALALAMTAALWALPRRTITRALVGLAIGLSPYLVHVLTAGLGNVWQGTVVDPVFRLRAGRSLSVPPPWDEVEGLARLSAASRSQEWWPLPRLEPSQQLFVWFFLVVAATALLVVVGVVAVRRDPGGFRAHVLLAMGMLSLGVLPQTLQRADSNHLAWVSAITLALVPAALAQVLLWWRPQWSGGRAGLVAGAGVLVVVALVVPTWVTRPYATFVDQSIRGTTPSFAVEWGDRKVYGGGVQFQRATQDLVDAVHEIGRPGDRVIVGPMDLSRTPYVESFLYHLLPEFEPGTYFIEMEPGITNAEGTRLTDELRRADILIQSSLFSGWDEPNDSTKPGDPRPNRVVDEEFCTVDEFGPGYYRLSVRCDRLGG